MPKITRNSSGLITYRNAGKSINLDMYLFSRYIMTLNYGKHPLKRITPKTAKLKHVKQFLKLEGLI